MATSLSQLYTITATSSHNHQIMATMSVQYDHGHLLVTTIQSWSPLCHNYTITDTSSYNHKIMATMSVQHDHGHLLVTTIQSWSTLYHSHFFSQPSDNDYYVSTTWSWTSLCHYHTIMATSLSQPYMVAMFVNGSELNEQSLYRTFQGCFLPNFDSFGQAVTEGKIF